MNKKNDFFVNCYGNNWRCSPYINDRVSNYYEANANFEIFSILTMTSKMAHYKL